jgi:inosine-uridine nucleoside N-ribohydrolase
MNNIRQKVIFFIDTDKDDLLSLCLACAQHYYNIIDLVGIVIESGFIIDIQSGLLITKQWLNLLHIGTNLDTEINNYPFKINLYAGYPRPIYLEKRLFPDKLVYTYLNLLKINLNITIPNYNYITGTYTNQIVEPFAPSVDILYKDLFSVNNKSLKCITTSPTTSLALGVDKYLYLKNKLECIYSMTSNYLVPGNVPAENNFNANITLPNPYIEYNGEYNAFMNPNSLQRLCLLIKDNIDINIIPLDCTNYAPLNINTFNQLKDIAQPFFNYITNPWIINISNSFLSFIYIDFLSQEIDGNYLWDLVATNIALGSNIDQNYLLGNPKISITGKMELNYYNNNDKVKIYNYLNYTKLLENSIRILFNDDKYKN